MRLWHIDLIPYLPKSQLLAQWRELNSIFKNKNKHILINYVYEYPMEDLDTYSKIVLKEMNNRGYRFNLDNYLKYFFWDKYMNCSLKGIVNEYIEKVCNEIMSNENSLRPFKKYHDKEYLTICYYNLKEKHMRGQKDFTNEVWQKLDKFYQKEIK